MGDLIQRDYSHLFRASYEDNSIVMLKLPEPVLDNNSDDLVGCESLGIDLTSDANFIFNYMKLCYQKGKSGERLVDLMAGPSIQSGPYEVKSLKVFSKLDSTKKGDEIYRVKVRRKLEELGLKDDFSLVRYFIDSYVGNQPEDLPRREMDRTMYEINPSGIEKITMHGLAQILFSDSVRRLRMRLKALNI